MSYRTFQMTTLPKDIKERFYQTIKGDISVADFEQVINWLETKKIILTGKQDEIGHYGFEDLRTEAEKKSKLWATISEDKKTGFSASKNTLWETAANKKWGSFGNGNNQRTRKAPYANTCPQVAGH